MKKLVPSVPSETTNLKEIVSPWAPLSWRAREAKSVVKKFRVFRDHYSRTEHRHFGRPESWDLGSQFRVSRSCPPVSVFPSEESAAPAFQVTNRVDLYLMKTNKV